MHQSFCKNHMDKCRRTSPPSAPLLHGGSSLHAARIALGAAAEVLPLRQRLQRRGLRARVRAPAGRQRQRLLDVRPQLVHDLPRAIAQRQF